MTKLKLGAHLCDPINNAKKLPITYIQFFVIGPQNYKTVEWLNTREKRAKFRDFPYKKIVHGSYVDHPWSGNKVAIYNILRELRIAKEIGAEALIVHMSGNLDVMKTHLAKFAPKKDSRGPKIYLETDARTYWSPQLINQIEPIIANYSVGLCLDTAHLWSGGIDLSTAEMVGNYVSQIKNKKIISMIHLNDASSPFNNRRDIHEMIGGKNAKIWKKDNSGLCKLLQVFSAIPFIVEGKKINEMKKALHNVLTC